MQSLPLLRDLFAPAKLVQNAFLDDFDGLLGTVPVALEVVKFFLEIDAMRIRIDFLIDRLCSFGGLHELSG